jgi:HSP20 family molecular chaperone IbpA
LVEAKLMEPGDESKDQNDERIKRLEKRIEELEKEKESKKQVEPSVEGIVEGVVGQFIPGLGGIIKALERSSPEFRKRIAETDAEIKHRIDVGWSSKPVVDYSISTRPLGHGRRKAAPREPREVRVTMPESAPPREPIVDVIEGKDQIVVIAELPGVSEEELEIKLEGRALEITAGQFVKKVELPGTPKSIAERTYKNGILQLKIDRELDDQG